MPVLLTRPFVPRGMLQMAESDRERVGGVVCAWHAGDLKESTDHVLYLPALMRLVPTTAFFTARGAYSHRGDSLLDRRKEGDAAGVSELQGRLGVLRRRRSTGAFVRPVPAEEGEELTMDVSSRRESGSAARVVSPRRRRTSRVRSRRDDP